MIFNYFKETGCHYRRDEDGCVFDSEEEGYFFDYEVTDSEALYELAYILVDDEDIFPENENIPKEQKINIARRFLQMTEVADAASGILNYYYDALKKVFEKEALASEDE